MYIHISWEKLYAYVFITYQFYCVKSDDVEIETLSGRIKGFRTKVLKRSLNVFLGVPYAEAPVGDLRFQRPAPRKPWDGVWDSTELPPPCPQTKSASSLYSNQVYNMTSAKVMSEDCLYLNIWAPEGAEDAPVMIWIHGGAFATGSTSLSFYDGKYLAADQNLIVVSLQYRLGLLGFLYLGTDDAPGNMALLDQHLALKWVHDNIQSFGGDPNHVTVFGESAGAASIYLHSMSSLPRYFKNAILQSTPKIEGFALVPKETAYETSIKMATKLQCASETTLDVISCLKSLEADHIVNILQGSSGYSSTEDGYFFEQFPTGIPSNGEDLSVIIGLNAHDGSCMLLYRVEVKEDGEVLLTSNQRHEVFLSQMPNIDPLRMGDVIGQYGGARGNTDNLSMMTDFLTDFWYGCTASNMAVQFAAAGSRVYLYELRHRSSACLWPKWCGVAHLCDVDLVFGMPLGTRGVYTEKDKEMSAVMRKHWGNMARSGNPHWHMYSRTTRQYLILDASHGQMKEWTREEDCEVLKPRVFTPREPKPHTTEL